MAQTDRSSSDRPSSNASIDPVEDAPPTSPSLLLRLALSALLALIVTLGLIGLAIQQAYRGAAELAMQERLEAAAFQVLAGMDVDPDGTLQPPLNLGDSLLAQPGSGLYAGVESALGEWTSPSALGVSVSAPPTPVQRGEQRMVTLEAQGRYGYLLGLGWELADGRIVDLTVWTVEDATRLEAALGRFRTSLWRWLGVAGVVLLLALVLLLAQPLLVLRRVSGEVAGVEAGRADRLRGRYPRELVPLTANLNALLETERTNAEQYQRALGDLAHSLKTPVAVLRTQLDDDAVDLDSLRDTVDHMQLRIRAELDRAARSGRRTMRALVGVRPVLERAVRTLGKLYRQVDFELEVTDNLAANVAERDLLELVGNLAENSAKYGAKRVRVEASQGTASLRRRGLELRVDDDGPGMEPKAFETMLQRGVRGDQRRSGPVDGQGLGLSIVERIVGSYDGAIRAERSPLGGLRVVIDLPPEARRPPANRSETERKTK